jgi:hypothetical protein
MDTPRTTNRQPGAMRRAELVAIILPLCLATLTIGCGGPDPVDKGPVVQPPPAPPPIVTPMPPPLPHPLPPPPQPVTLTWTLADRCADGLGVQARFFDLDNDLVWPDASHVYVIDSGGSATYRLTCVPGAKICYGATTDPDNGRYWGVGISREYACSNCCYTCEAQNVGFNLVCN